MPNRLVPSGSSKPAERVRLGLWRGIASVKRAIHEVQAGDDGQAWTDALKALDVLEERYFAPVQAADHAAQTLPARNRPAFVAIIGIDRFGSLREEIGAQLSARVIAALRARIEAQTLGVEIGRINRSSIEFAFAAADVAAAERSLVALQQALEAPVIADGTELCLDITIGFAARHGEHDLLDTLIDRAEHALSKARAHHQKVACFTEQDRVNRAERLALMRDLRGALGRRELFVCYQPQLNVRTGQISAAEALVRWNHPRLGPVPPDHFVSLAEESQEIRRITEFVVEQTVADWRSLKAQGLETALRVNLSGQLVADMDFASWALSAIGDSAQGMGFEITETAVIANPQRALENIGRFAAAGMKIAIDDYGSGLSSLSYLKQIPADELKIDKAFVMGLTSSHRDPLLIRSTIDLAHALEMEITAEGVDDPMSLALLRVMGCDHVQGYHVAKPLTFDDLVGFLQAHLRAEPAGDGNFDAVSAVFKASSAGQ